MDSIFSWVATIATVVAASLTASNLGSRITGYGFVIFTIGSVAWLALGATTGQPALVWTNGALTLLNLFGIWRWLGRQAKVDEGSKAASRASEDMPGEALFPVSLLSSGTVRTGDTEIGSCVGAMAGAASGRLSYVIVSQGGIGGAGETLRKLPWDRIEVEGDRLGTDMTEREFRALEPVPRDRWPAR